MIKALILFIVTYILMLSIPKCKGYIAFTSACFFIFLGIIPLNKIVSEIDFNVLMMLFGTMGTVSLFIESKMPSLLADKLIKISPNVKWLTIYLAVFAGIVSAFIDNVATVLMIAPVIIVLAKKLDISPIPVIISVSIFSNIEGAATLVGDTTSILLAGAMKLDFFDFFVYDNKMGLFFIVQFGLLAATIVLYFLQRKNKDKIDIINKTDVSDYISTYLLILTVVSLIIVSFIPNKYELTNGIICISYFIVGLIIKIIKNREVKSILYNIKDIDFETILLLASLFVIIGGIKEAGVIDAITNLFLMISSDNVILMYTVITFVSVFISAFIDNIPYVATMLPVVLLIGNNMGINPTILYYGLIIGSTLGGNYTPIGASANIAAIGILKKNGYKFKNRDYYKYSLPITSAAILTGYIICLLLFLK